jgi:hypothetical protein
LSRRSLSDAARVERFHDPIANEDIIRVAVTIAVKVRVSRTDLILWADGGRNLVAEAEDQAVGALESAPLEHAVMKMSDARTMRFEPQPAAQPATAAD